MGSDAAGAIDVTGQGPPVVLIHGLGLDRRLWDPFVPRLAKRSRVITYDILGHGSAPPLRAPTTLDDFDAQLVAVLDRAAAERAVVVGFSLGGVIARATAASHPERVAALVLLNTIARRPPEIRRQVLDRADRLDTGQGESLAAEAIERWFTPSFRDARPDVIASVLDRLARNDPVSYRHAYRLFAEADETASALHPRIRVPALVITGADDRNSTPEMARQIADALPGSECRILRKLRHMGLVEDPDAVLDLIVPFLRHVAGPRPD